MFRHAIIVFLRRRVWKNKRIKYFKGSVKKFKYEKTTKIRYSVPHVGWNSTNFKKEKNEILDGISEKDFMYFVHSYYGYPDKKIISTKTHMVKKNLLISDFKNLFACQFHPERSGEKGIKIYKNFKKII